MFTTIRLQLALSCENDWEVEGMEVKTTFLNSECQDTVYMEVPEGVLVPTQSRRLDYGPPLACHSLKSIYRLKQSQRTLYCRKHTFFLANNILRSELDHSLFINYFKRVILLLYMDDLVLTAPAPQLIAWIKQKLHEEFERTHLGELRTFLRLEIKRDYHNRTLHLSQTKYITNILVVHGMSFCNPSLTPADPDVRLEKSRPEFTTPQFEKQKYQYMVEPLIYAMLGTRSDLAYAVSQVNQHSTNPNPAHWTSVKRIFQYLAGTTHLRFWFGKQGDGAGFTDGE